MIANYLFAEKIKNPSAYMGYVCRTKGDKNPYLWTAQTISSILSRQEYCGDTVNFKTQRKSCMSKQIIYNNPEDYKIFIILILLLSAEKTSRKYKKSEVSEKEYLQFRSLYFLMKYIVQIADIVCILCV